MLVRASSIVFRHGVDVRNQFVAGRRRQLQGMKRSYRFAREPLSSPALAQVAVAESRRISGMAEASKPSSGPGRGIRHYGVVGPVAGFVYRKPAVTPTATPEHQVQRIEQQITRKVIQEIAQTAPWRAQMEQAVVTPRLLHTLADQVAGELNRRVGLQRYRRGL
ncbi:hypothetical protein [Pseudoxanthomonas broegbernensis]|nr:hypothetical protein [Pseudoxanthomonas broegbernensis]MBB6064889.1 hypothetical protein [Pseudoxanthomonas broegbernensis]